MFSVFILICLILSIFIFIITYSKDDSEALIVSGFIIAAYFILKFIIYTVNYADSSKLMDSISSAFQVFLKYLVSCLIFVLIFIIVYPIIRRK